MIDANVLGAQHRRRYPSGARIQSDKADRELYVVVSGQIGAYRLAENKPEKAVTLGPGQLFGQEWFFAGVESLLYITAEEAELFVVSQSGFDGLVRQNPRLAYALLEEALCPAKPASPAATVKAPPAATKPAEEKAPAAENEGTVATATTGASAVAAAIPAGQEGLFPPGHKGYPGVTHPEYEQYVDKKELTCPYCHKKFSGKKVFTSKLKSAAPTRYDLRHTYVDFSQEWYGVVTCPHCYFSALFNNFTEGSVMPKLIRDALREAQDQILLDFDAPRDLDFVFASHYLALKCSPAFAARRQIDMLLWSDLSWLYEDAGDEAMERYAANQTALAAETVYMESNLTPAQEQQVCLVIAAMQHRAGEDRSLKKWLYNAKTNREGKPMLRDLADKLNDMLREE